MASITPHHILEFWFIEHGPRDWFASNPDFDAKITKQFGDAYPSILAGKHHNWRETAEGRLAEIIVLDQFSRNLFRGTAKAFAADPIALSLAQEAIAVDADQALNQQQRWMLYLPFMHSESLAIHKIAIDLFTKLGLDQVLDYEIRHKDIIERFGRYPHRNAALGRQSTQEELAFLDQPGSSF